MFSLTTRALALHFLELVCICLQLASLSFVSFSSDSASSSHCQLECRLFHWLSKSETWKSLESFMPRCRPPWPSPARPGPSRPRRGLRRLAALLEPVPSSAAARPAWPRTPSAPGRPGSCCGRRRWPGSRRCEALAPSCSATAFSISRRACSFSLLARSSLRSSSSIGFAPQLLGGREVLLLAAPPSRPAARPAAPGPASASSTVYLPPDAGAETSPGRQQETRQRKGHPAREAPQARDTAEHHEEPPAGPEGANHRARADPALRARGTSRRTTTPAPCAPRPRSRSWCRGR